MHFTTFLAVLIAATTAAPVVERSLDAIPLSIFLGLGCNSKPIAVTTAYVPNDGKCFSISPIISGNTDSGIIDQTLLRKLPAGCKLIAYSDGDCTSVNTITYDVTGRCGTFGPGLLIKAAKTVGTCF